MPLRIVKPWLLLDWIYKLTETASAELDQKRKLDEFTKKVFVKLKKEQNSMKKKITEKNAMLTFSKCCFR